MPARQIKAPDWTDPATGITYLMHAESTVQYCSDDNCKEKLKPVFCGVFPAPNAESWFWHECVICNEYFCPKHAESCNDDGQVVCITCLQTPNLEQRLQQER